MERGSRNPAHSREGALALFQFPRAHTTDDAPSSIAAKALRARLTPALPGAWLLRPSFAKGRADRLAWGDLRPLNELSTEACPH